MLSAPGTAAGCCNAGDRGKRGTGRSTTTGSWQLFNAQAAVTDENMPGQKGLQVVAPAVVNCAPVHGLGHHLQQAHRDIAVQEAQPLQQEAPAMREM